MISIHHRMLTVIVLLLYSTSCKGQGYCRFPSYLWRSIRNNLEDHMDTDPPYRKWYSRTEYIRNTHTWTRQKEIEAYETEIVIHHRFHASCTGYAPPGEVPCYRQTKTTRFICVAEEPEGKFRVQHLSVGQPTFTCLKFVRRTEFIVQVFFAVRNEINVDKLCYDVALQRDEWPWIDVAHAPIVPCPFIGGFDFRGYTGELRIERCPKEWRPSRLESECVPGEGVRLTFPSPDCSFLIKGAVEQNMMCRGSWAEESFHFIVLSDVAGPPRYILRLPVNMDDSRVSPPVFAILYFSLVVPASGRGQPPGSVLYEELRLYRSDTALCYDESTECQKHAREGKCQDLPIYQLANHCKRSCGLCDFVPSDKPECQFPAHYQGNWSLITPSTIEGITIEGGTIQSASLGNYVCKSKHWDLEYYKVLSVFPNGCRPRYSCFQLLPLGPEMIQFRIFPPHLTTAANSSLEDRSFDICSFDVKTPDWQTPLLDHVLKTLFNKDKLHLNFCGLGGIFHANASFTDGTYCEGTISDVDHVTCRIHEQLRLSFHSCHGIDIQDFICVAFTQLPQGTSFLVTRPVMMQASEKYQCWVIKQPEGQKKGRKLTRMLQFNRAKCTTAEIYYPKDDPNGLLSVETFSDFVESDCDSYHGAMERLFQGSSTGKSLLASSPPNKERADDDPWKSYDKYWSRDHDATQNTGSAVKRFTTSGSCVINISGILYICILLSYLIRIKLLPGLCSLSCSGMSL